MGRLRANLSIRRRLASTVRKKAVLRLLLLFFFAFTGLVLRIFAAPILLAAGCLPGRALGVGARSMLVGPVQGGACSPGRPPFLSKMFPQARAFCPLSCHPQWLFWVFMHSLSMWTTS
jgi:hypothetical protein